MPKIVWLDQNRVREQVIPERGFITLGRGPQNTVRLSDPQVSQDHVQLVCGPHGCLLKDLKSLHDVSVNASPVKQRFLRSGDIIRIGRQVLEYLDDNAGAARRESPRPVKLPPARAPNEGKERAFLRVVAGPRAGQIVALDRPLIALGDPEGYYAAVSRRSQGYFLLNLGKCFYARLNDEQVFGAGNRLKDGDRIGLGDEQMEMRIFRPREH